MIFFALLAAAVVSGLGWMISNQRANASAQTAKAIANVEGRRRLTVVDK